MRQEYDWYCSCCGKDMPDGSAEIYDADGDAHCSKECADEANSDIREALGSDSSAN